MSTLNVEVIRSTRRISQSIDTTSFSLVIDPSSANVEKQRDTQLIPSEFCCENKTLIALRIVLGRRSCPNRIYTSTLIPIHRLVSTFFRDLGIPAIENRRPSSFDGVTERGIRRTSRLVRSPHLRDSRKLWSVKVQREGERKSRCAKSEVNEK
jgi:hypothetical protein